MGLHQKIINRVTSEPCNCGADDDHVEDQFFVHATETKPYKGFAEAVREEQEAEKLAEAVGDGTRRKGGNRRK